LLGFFAVSGLYSQEYSGLISLESGVLDLGSEGILENDTPDPLLYCFVESSVLVKTAQDVQKIFKDPANKLRYLAPFSFDAALPKLQSQGKLLAVAQKAKAQDYDYYIQDKTSTEPLLVSALNKAGSLKAKDLVLKALPISLDGQFADWQALPDLRRFSSNQAPLEAYQTDGGTSVKITDQGLYKRKAGTDLEKIKVLKTASFLYYLVSSYSAQAEGLSIFIKVYDPQKANEKPLFTLEIPRLSKSGTILLWKEKDGKTFSRTVGSFAAQAYYLEACINWTALNADEQKALSASRQQISSWYSEGGLGESYTWADFALNDK